MAMAVTMTLEMWTTCIASFIAGAAGATLLSGALGRGGKKGREGRPSRRRQMDLIPNADFLPSESEEDEDDDSALPGGSIRNNFGLMDGPFKLLLIVNSELKMGKGKIAAQCCHASIGCYKTALKYSPDSVRAWEYLGQAKICVKCPTEKEMWEIREKAREVGLVTYLVMDAGRTQIASGSRTVLGIGPAPVSAFGFTDHLKLM